MVDEVVEEIEEGTEIEIPEEPEEKIDPKVAQEKLTPEHPRFKEVYGKMKDLERRVGEYEETQKLTREHNAALVKAIEKSAEVTREALINKDDSATDDKMIEQLNAKLTELKASKIAAKKGFDFEVEAKIDDAIFEVRDAIKEATLLKKERKSTPSEKHNDADQDQMLVWAKVTPWYFGDDADPLMRAAAHELDRMLVRDPKWENVEPSERLKEVGKRIEARFGWKPNNKVVAFQKKPGGVESAGGDKGGASKIVRLSAAELRTAQGLGVSPEEYAKQKTLMGGV